MQVLYQFPSPPRPSHIHFKKVTISFQSLYTRPRSIEVFTPPCSHTHFTSRSFQTIPTCPHQNEKNKNPPTSLPPRPPEHRPNTTESTSNPTKAHIHHAAHQRNPLPTKPNHAPLPAPPLQPHTPAPASTPYSRPTHRRPTFPLAHQAKTTRQTAPLAAHRDAGIDARPGCGCCDGYGRGWGGERAAGGAGGVDWGVGWCGGCGPCGISGVLLLS